MGVIVLPEDISIKKIKDLQKMLLDEIQRDDTDVVIDFSPVTRTDFSVYQLLRAFARECKRKKKVLKIKGATPAAREQMKLCGML